MKINARRGAFLVLAAVVAARLFFIAKLMTSIDDIGPLVQLTQERTAGMVAAVHDVARAWSYAPAQFALTRVLLGFANSYDSILFWGRLPSLLFWACGIWGSFVLFLRFFREYEEGTALAVLLGVILVVSWRGLIESSQGYNYATTLPIAAVLIWSFSFLDRRNPLVTGFLLGSLSWVTYQALFLVAAWFLAWLVLIVLERDRKGFMSWLWGGVGFSLPVAAVFLFSLRLWAKEGVPAWAAADVPGSGILTKVTFIPVAWFRVIQNDFTFVPWGVGSALVAAIITAITVVGLLRLRTARSDHEKKFLVLAASVGTVWTIGACLGRFPLGSTRHAYILQLPLAMTFGTALSYMKSDRRVLYAAAVLVCGIFGGFVPGLYQATESRMDMPLIAAEARANPSALVIDPFLSLTWDQMLLDREAPDLRGRLFQAEWRRDYQPTAWDQILKLRSRLFHTAEPAIYQKPFQRDWETVLSDPRNMSLILVSHRSRITDDQRQALRTYHFEIRQTIAEVEPFTPINRLTQGFDGGLASGYFYSNGFFVYLATRGH